MNSNKNPLSSTISNQKLILSHDHRNSLNEQQMKLYPYNCIGLITFTTTQGQSIGTGFLITSDLVLTSAHNVITLGHQKQIQHHSDMSFCVGVSGKVKEKIKIIKMRYCQNYLKGLQECDMEMIHKSDYAILKIEKEIHLQKYIKIGCNFCQSNADILICGYPGEKVHLKNRNIDSAYLFEGRNKISGFCKGGIEHLVDTTEGQSGSPIMVQKQGVYYAIGIHKSSLIGKNLNLGTLILTQHYLKILQWELQMKLTQIQANDFSNQNCKTIKTQTQKAIVKYTFKKDHLKWDLSTQWSTKFKINDSKLKFSDEDTYRYQLTSLKPLSKKNTFTLKIISNSWDIGFGIITEKRKKQRKSGYIGPEHESSVGYWTHKNLVGRSIGAIFVDGKLCQKDEEQYFVGEGDWLKMEVDLTKMKIKYWNKKVQFQSDLNQSWKKQKLFVFVMMVENNQQVQVCID